MKKEVLSEINRTREIMGLEMIIEQEETTKELTKLDKEDEETKSERDQGKEEVEATTPEEKEEALGEIKGGVSQIVKVFKSIDPAERDEFRKVIIGTLKKKKTDERIINAIIKALDKVGDSTPIEEQMRPIVGGKFVGWKNWWKHKAYGLINLFSLNLIRYAGPSRQFGRKLNFYFGRYKQGENKKMNSLADTSVTIPEDEWEEYYEDNNKKFKKKIVKGKEIWESSWDYKNDDEEYEFRPFMIAAIEQYKSFDRYGRRKVKIRVGNKPKETKILLPRPDPIYVSRQFTFPTQGQPSADYFEDNEFVPTKKLKDNLKLMIIDPLEKEALKLDPPEGKPAYWLRTLAIATSCSAIKNGTSSDGVKRTWVQLAEARAQAGLDYIIEQLKTLDPPMLIGNNGKEDTQFDINAKGKNVGKKSKDGSDLTGTSGPVWKDYPDNWDEMDDKQQEEWKKEYLDKSKYEEHKFFVCGFDILINDQQQQEDDDYKEEYEIIYTDKRAVGFNIPGKSPRKRKIRFRLPTFKLGWPIFGWIGKIFSKRKRWDSCPDFD